MVIGSGATAITLIPSHGRRRGARHHAAAVADLHRLAAGARTPSPTCCARSCPTAVAGAAIRWFLALVTQGSTSSASAGPSWSSGCCARASSASCPPGYDIDTHFTPTYNPWDQRLCVVPNGDLFKAIRAGTASVVTDHIDTFTEKGLLLESGAELEADIIVTATGLELLFIGGIELSVDGEEVDLPSKLTYKGMMLEGVPNLALAIGYTNASWTLKCDLTCDYVCRLLNHMRDDRAPAVHAGQRGRRP